MRHALILLVTALAACATPPAPAPTDAETNQEILETLDAFFLAFHAKDAAALRGLTAGPGHVRALSKPKDGGLRMRGQTLDEWVDFVATSPDSLVEVYWDPVIQTDGVIAQAWTPFEIKIDGVFGQCGVNMFTLIRTDFGWRVVDITYSGQREGCAARRPATSSAYRPAALSAVFLAAD